MIYRLWRSETKGKKEKFMKFLSFHFNWEVIAAKGESAKRGEFILPYFYA